MPSSSFLTDAVVFKESSDSFTLDAEVYPRRFTADAWLVNDTTQQHHRLRDHYGADSDLYVVLSKDVGKYVAYTPIHYVLEDMLQRLAYLEDYDRTHASFTADAWLAASGTYGRGIAHVDAVAKKTMTGTDYRFWIDAWVRLGSAFTIDARIHGIFTIDAFIT